MFCSSEKQRVPSGKRDNMCSNQAEGATTTVLVLHMSSSFLTHVHQNFARARAMQADIQMTKQKKKISEGITTTNTGNLSFSAATSRGAAAHELLDNSLLMLTLSYLSAMPTKEEVLPDT
mmetsp:Transcript_18719/g.50251  ORF Transcript_18719/g.50251 Transcript_18719/m.50251 type:complete len:120 (+) Transcript_18719:183-542(+)